MHGSCLGQRVGPCRWKNRGDCLNSNAQLLFHLGESVDGLLKVLLRMGGGNLRSDSGLALWDDGVAKADDIDAFFQQGVGHLRRQGCLAEHDRNDRVLAGQNVEAQFRHPTAEKSRVLMQPVAQLGRRAQ